MPLDHQKVDTSVAPTAGKEVITGAKWAGDMTEDEKQLLNILLSKPGESFEVLVSDKIPDNDLIAQITASMKCYGRMENGKRLLMPLIGRLLLIMQQRPSVIKSFGANDISDFCRTIAPRMFHISRTDSWEALQIAKAFPNVSSEDYVQIGPNKLKAIGKALDWAPSQEDAAKYMAYARDHNRHQLLDKMEEDGVNVDSLNLTKIAFPASQETRKRWKAFNENEFVRAYCDCRELEYADEVIFNRMLDECEATWVATEEFRKRREQEQDKSPF